MNNSGSNCANQKKTADETVATRPELVPRSSYPVAEASFIIERLILKARLSFEAASRVIDELIETFDLGWLPVSADSVRSWLIRIGVHAFVTPKTWADDWILLIDHMVQVGQEKCLVVFGIRASELPPPGVALQHSDLHALAVFATKKTSNEITHDQLDQVTKLIGGSPLAVLNDEGAELTNGVKIFSADHPTTACLDIAHKATNILKKAIVGDDDWTAYNTTVANIGARVRLTAASFLRPPSQRSKARFMNLGAQFNWAIKALGILDNPSLVSQHLAPELLEEKLGPLRVHRASIEQWHHLHQMCRTLITVVGSHGYCQATVSKARQVIAPLTTPESKKFADELIDFVAAQCDKAPEQYRLAASTEVLESVLGVYKATAGDHVQGGFTTLLPSIGALVGHVDTNRMYQALLETPVKVAKAFIADLLGTTYNAKRRQAFRATATQSVN